jgi:hypothetical protein
LNGKRIETAFGVDLTEAEVAGMKAVSDLYKNCQALNPAAIFVSSGPAQTLVDKPKLEFRIPTAAAN